MIKSQKIIEEPKPMAIGRKNWRQAEWHNRMSPCTEHPPGAPAQESHPRRDKRRDHYDGAVCQETLHITEEPSIMAHATADPGVSARSAAAQPARSGFDGMGEEARAANQSAALDLVPQKSAATDRASCFSRPPLPHPCWRLGEALHPLVWLVV